MADNLVSQYGNWLFLIVVLGSIVDLFQFSWIMKRMWKRRQRGIEARAMQTALLALYEQKRLKGKKQ